MSLLWPRAEFVYGNTRLRARRGELLDAVAYAGLLERDPEGLLAALTETAYRPEVEDALARFSGERRLHEALRAHLGRTAGELRTLYEGRALELLDLWLARFDLQNLLALLRRQLAGPAAAEDVLAAIVPVGGIDAAAAEEVARRSEPAEALGLLIAWRLPDPDTAAQLRAAYAEYERTDDLAELETTLAAGHAARTVAGIAAHGAEGVPLLALVEAELDARNVLLVLRLREALERSELAEPALPRRAMLPGGAVALSRLEAALSTPSPAAAVAALADACPPSWRGALERFAAGGALAALERELDAARARAALTLFHSGDPLGVGLAVAFAAAKELEGRNLRLVGRAAAGELDRELAREMLVLP